MNESVAEGDASATNPCSGCFGYLAVLYLCGESEIYYIYMMTRVIGDFGLLFPTAHA